MVNYKVPERPYCYHECSCEQSQLKAKIKALEIKGFFYKQKIHDLDNVVGKLRNRIQELYNKPKKGELNVR